MKKKSLTLHQNQYSLSINATITAIIVDDEQDSRESIQSMLQEAAPGVKVVANVDSAKSGLEALLDHQPDLVFLDVQMPEHDGFWLAERMKGIKHQSRIVFVTAYDEYAIEAFKYSAFDFLTKPVAPERMKQVIDRFNNENDQEDLHKKLENLTYYLNRSKLKFNTHDGFIIVRAEEIVFCKADRNYSEINMASGEKYLICSSLLSLEAELKPFSFIRISRSHLINIDYLEKYYRNSKQVVLSSDNVSVTLKASASGVKRLMEI
ncbi:MAG: LytTR family DNA-binding domain-containing protein [Bacteroidales bacterium]|nr:LytTR family DNA-binding domain-containing protein [Bacteroidales bacterium]MCF8334149.1 LytTR family DNA-binding domain-containing protein [Bacteroidales bacterium]